VGKLPQLLLGMLATVLIAVGIAAQTGTVHMPGRPAAPQSGSGIGIKPAEAAPSSSPLYTPSPPPSPLPSAEVAPQPVLPVPEPVTKHKKRDR
jgi:hypothetical protein